MNTENIQYTVETWRLTEFDSEIHFSSDVTVLANPLDLPLSVGDYKIVLNSTSLL